MNQNKVYEVKAVNVCENFVIATVDLSYYKGVELPISYSKIVHHMNQVLKEYGNILPKINIINVESQFKEIGIEFQTEIIESIIDNDKNLRIFLGLRPSGLLDIKDLVINLVESYLGEDFKTECPGYNLDIDFFVDNIFDATSLNKIIYDSEKYYKIQKVIRMKFDSYNHKDLKERPKKIAMATIMKHIGKK